MASSMSFSQFEGAKPPSAASFVRQASQCRPRMYQTRAILFSIVSFLLLLWLFSSSGVSGLFVVPLSGGKGTTIRGYESPIAVLAKAQQQLS